MASRTRRSPSPASTATLTRRAAIYTRVSLDATGEGLAVARQEENARKLIDDRGWDVAGVWSDNSISASDASKKRPGYEALVAAYAAGQFDALVCYDLDRLTRQPRQLEDWIDAAEGRGLALVTLNGEADLTTDAGRLFARIKAAVARSEIERKSARQRAAAEQRANLGRPPLGVRLTGYTAKGETIASEADVVRRVFDAFQRGETLRRIAKSLSEDGVSTRHGKPWNPSSIREILTNPRYAGRVVYCGEVVPGVKGAWEPLVDDETFDIVAAKLADPRRRTQVNTDRVHVGSGLYRCADCGEPVSGWSGGRYRCRDAHVNRARGPVDQFVRDVITERLSRDDVAQLLAPTADALAPLIDQMRVLRAKLDDAQEDYAAGYIDGALYRARTNRIKDDLSAVERKIAAHPSSSALGDVVAADDPAEAFLTAPLMAQRSVIDALCVIKLHKGTRGSRTFNPETVQIEWRS
ncbi:recombinase family protein [Gordonia sp. L191]|uniref:recombinase family protein n=1 Tax=Gordonia sp. L191 TaxID=2982699 RepID=UPI0024BFD778|nr:recombinase family protein [Gordonia sp. L191]WHU48673.1 recombinase family protein [Gordonia sp. L191]